MDLSKSMEYFDPSKEQTKIHIIGCGSVGSAVAENLVRCGLENITLWDFDHVEEHNLVNQMFNVSHIGKPKAEALKEILVSINPDAEKRIRVKPNGWQGENTSGYIFLCADVMDVRRGIVKQNMDNQFVKAVFDFRTGLEYAQVWSADWSDENQRKSMWNSMQYTDEEAKGETPVSACGFTLGVVTTVRVIAGLGVSNFINFSKGEGLKQTIIANCFEPSITVF